LSETSPTLSSMKTDELWSSSCTSTRSWTAPAWQCAGFMRYLAAGEVAAVSWLRCLRFSQLCCWSYKSFGMLRRSDW